MEDVGRNDDMPSEYEIKRLQRMEENQRMLQSLDLPTMLRPSPRNHNQAMKDSVKSEPTRRSSRQQKLRQIAEQHEREKSLEEQLEIERQAALKREREAYIALKKQQLEYERLLKRKQLQEEEQRKKQKIKERKKKDQCGQLKVLQVPEVHEGQILEWRQQEVRRQRELEQLPPEQVAQRNAEIQKFIQDELDKQAKLAKEQKQRQANLPQSEEDQTKLNQPTARINTEEIVSTDAKAHEDVRKGEDEFEVVL